MILAKQSAEDLFKQFDKGTEIMQSELRSSYLDALLENAENLLDNGKVRVEDNVPKESAVKTLTDIYQSLDIENQDRETIRRLLQLSLLKVIRKDAIQANHQMTPDTIGMIIAYLIEQIVKLDHPYRIFDLTVGTANLLTCVMNHLAEVVKQPLEGYGIDNDDSMLAVASVSTGLQKLPVHLYHQDAIQALDIPTCDIAVADLPVGYYPLDQNTVNYRTRAQKGHSYVHHLLIEQSMNYLTPGGWGFFLIPSNLFQTKESKSFVEWIQSVAHLQGLINLPADLFANEAAQKSVLILQRQGGNAKQAAKVLLGNFPSLKNKAAMQKFIAEVDQWVKMNIR